MKKKHKAGKRTRTREAGCDKLCMPLLCTDSHLFRVAGFARFLPGERFETMEWTGQL